MSKVKAVSVRLVGSAMQRGRQMSGWTEITLENGKVVFVPDGGIDQALDYADSLGYIDTSEARAKADNWVKTGKWELPDNA